MKRARFSEGKIISLLKERRTGAGAADLRRKREVSNATFCKWRSKYGGLEVTDAKRLEALEAGNATLKMLPGDQVETFNRVLKIFI